MKSLREFFTGNRQKERSLATVSSHGEHRVVYQTSSNQQVQTATRYKCPMGCEGDKTYDSPGNCPVCNMKLVPVSEAGSHSHEQGHQGHGHGHHGCC